MTRFTDLSEDLGELLGLQRGCIPEFKPMGYIYFLFLRGVLEYVGKTRHLDNRIEAHRKDKKFDRVGVLTVDPEDPMKIDLARLEETCILAFKPRLNVNRTGEIDKYHLMWLGRKADLLLDHWKTELFLIDYKVGRVSGRRFDSDLMMRYYCEGTRRIGQANKALALAESRVRWFARGSLIRKKFA